MKITDLTIEKVLETVNLMKQLHISCSIVEMAKELGVKRTELMQFINAHPKNINWDVATFRKYSTGGRIASDKKVAVITGVFLDPHDNPLSEEYANDRKGEHWIRLTGIWDSGWIYGFMLATNPKPPAIPVTNSWENQPEDIEKFLKISKVATHQFSWGYGMGSHYSQNFENSIVCDDFNEAIEEGHKMGLRFCFTGYGSKEINKLLDMDEHFASGFSIVK